MHCGQHAAFFLVQGLGGVEHDQYDCRIGECLAAARDPELLYFFESLAQARGVNQLQRNPIERNALCHQVARGSRRRGHDGSIALYETVEERTLAGVGPANDRHRQSVVHNAAARERSFKRGKRWQKLGDAAGDLGLRSYVNVIFGEVDAGFEQSDQFDKGLLDGRDAAAEGATHLACGLARLGEGLCVDEIAHRLSLREIELAGEECALSEFAGVRQPRAKRKCAPQQQVEYHGRSMRGNLYKFIAGIGIGRGEKGDHRLVDAVRLALNRSRRAPRRGGRAHVRAAGAGARAVRRSRRTADR